MNSSFSERLSLLRREKNISQRQAAGDLGISQALLSHYENGAREPGLSFVCKACDYYGVTADYLLCRADSKLNDMLAAKSFLSQIRTMVDRAEMLLDEIHGENK